MYTNCDKSDVKPGFEALESRLLLAADLTVEAAAIDYEALSGAAVAVDIQVNNIGDADAEDAVNPGVDPWTVSLWRSDDAVFDPLVDFEVDTFTRLTLADGDDTTDTITFNAPAAGEYTLFAWADSLLDVTEDDDDNNTAIVGTLLVGIDLEIQGAAGAYEAAAGANVDVDVTVENTGFAQAVTDANPGVDSWTVSLWTSTDGTWDVGDTQVGSYNVTTLAGGANTTDTISFNAPVPGEYTLFGFADSDEEVTEDDDANNTASLGTLSVGPDLTIEAAATAYQAADGQQVDVPVQVNNAGFAVAEDDANPGVDPWTVSLWLSTDGAFDAGADTQVGSYNVTSLAADANTTDTISFNAPAGAQSYTLFGVADQPGGVTEYSEANNVSVVGNLGVGPDLTIAIDDAFVTGNEQIPGDRRSWIPVQVTNGGAGTASGLATIQVYGSVDGVIDGGDYLFGERTYRIRLGAGQARTYWIRTQPPADIPAGNYNVLAVVDSGDTIAEADEDNNTDAAANQASIVWKFGGFDAAHRNARLTIEDPNGDPVTFMLRGGWAEVANGTNGFDVTLHETTNRSAFFMQTGRGVATEVESVTVVDNLGLAWDGSLGRLDARTTDFVDDGAGTSLIDVPGTLRSIWLNDVTGGEIQVGAPVGARDTLTMRLGSVTDLVVTSVTPINCLFAQDWTDSGGVADVITTPSIRYFRTIGDVNGLDLTLAGNPVARRYTLGTAYIGGDLINATWAVGGSAGRARVLGTITGCGLSFDEDVRSITAGAIDNSAISLATVNPAGAHATLGHMYVAGVGGNYFVNNSTLDVWTIRRLYFGAASVGTGTITYNSVGRAWNLPTGVNVVTV